MEPHDELRRLEERLLEPQVRRSPAEVAELLADEFSEIGASGRALDKAAVLQSLAAEEPVQRSMTQFRVTLLAPGVALATYRIDAVIASSGASSASLRSSIWRRDGGRWRIVFHQGTPVSRTEG